MPILKKRTVLLSEPVLFPFSKNPEKKKKKIWTKGGERLLNLDKQQIV